MPREFPHWILGLSKSKPEENADMPEQQYVNYYRCPYDGTEWADVWSCCCNDQCPKCDVKDIEPYKSEEVTHTSPRQRKPVKRSPC